ncbi:MAG: GIY-YIG nuclease family protein [Ferruginibacter sp.]
MTLHEAIEKLLRQKGHAMTTQQIADELNKNGWYKKKDNSEIQAFQIHGRTRNYEKIFVRSGSTVSLFGQLNNKPKVEINIEPKKIVKNISQEKSRNFSSLEKNLMTEESFVNALEIDNLIPNVPGLYCIRIFDHNNLPKPFNKYLADRNHNIIYLGIATGSLKKRFLNQELRAKGHGTFFRSIGAILGYRPIKGSLTTKKNKRNYKFEQSDEKKIVEWINKNLKVNWIELDNNYEEIETELITKYKPLINLAKNPEALEILSKLRKECVEIANQE